MHVGHRAVNCQSTGCHSPLQSAADVAPVSAVSLLPGQAVQVPAALLALINRSLVEYEPAQDAKALLVS
jgi:hypothetical protein